MNKVVLALTASLAITACDPISTTQFIVRADTQDLTTKNVTANSQGNAIVAKFLAEHGYSGSAEFVTSKGEKCRSWSRQSGETHASVCDTPNGLMVSLYDLGQFTSRNETKKLSSDLGKVILESISNVTIVVE